MNSYYCPCCGCTSRDVLESKWDDYFPDVRSENRTSLCVVRTGCLVHLRVPLSPTSLYTVCAHKLPAAALAKKTADMCEKGGRRMSWAAATIISPPPKLLIAENNPAMLELLPHALESNIPGIEMDVCWSRDVAVQKLPRSHYDILVTNVALAGTANFSLLRQHFSLHPLMPVLVTARAKEHGIARQALDRGASDIIVAPLVPSEAVSAVQAAYKFWELRMAVALREKRLEFLCEKQALQRGRQLPTSFVNKTTMNLEEKFYSRKSTLQAYDRTIDALQRSLAIQTKQVTYLAGQIKQGAVRRLDVLLKMARHGGEMPQ